LDAQRARILEPVPPAAAQAEPMFCSRKLQNPSMRGLRLCKKHLSAGRAFRHDTPMGLGSHREPKYDHDFPPLCFRL